MRYDQEGFLKFVPHFLRPAIRNFRLLNFRLGQFRTVWTRQCVDAQGEPIPWYTYPAIEYIKQLDLRDRVIFEYGSGFSSLFYAPRCRQITCVEDDPKWFEVIQKKAPANCRILLKPEPDAYVNALLEQDGLFDIIIVDGSHRDRCCPLALQKLKPDGMVIVDNSDALTECDKWLAPGDFIQVDFAGFGPLNAYLWCTSLFLKRGFKCRSRHPHQPTLSVGP